MIMEPMQATSPPASPPSSLLPSGMLALPHLGILRVEGADAAKFLHGQLTQDFVLLGLDQARLAAYCTAKGRMLASFIGFKRTPDEILLVCNQTVLPPALKRLSMFVLRAKAKLSDASADFTVYGITGGVPNAPWRTTQDLDATVVDLYPAGPVARKLRIAPAASAAPALPPLPLDWWAWGEIASGVAMVSQPVAEAFVPQMLNYESIGGVNFKKGCYPGQEVVARSQFRGTLKRRAYILTGAAPMQAGQEVFAPSDAAQPVGTVVQAAPNPLGGWAAIASLQVAAAQTQALQLGPEAAAAPLNLLPMPYQLLEDI